MYYLYRHFNAKKELLYVGMSLSHLSRLREHKRQSRWFNQISIITIEKFRKKRRCAEAEAKAIRTENPRYNKALLPREKQTKFIGWACIYGQTQLAKKLGITRQRVGQWVRGKDYPPDKKKQEIVELSGGLLEYNDFFE